MAAAILSPHPLANAPVDRVVATQAALRAIGELRREHDSVLFFQPGGCRDESLLLCFLDDEFVAGDQELLLGEASGCPVYIDRRQYELWSTGQLILDVADGPPEGFSVPAGRGHHFVSRSRSCPPEALSPLPRRRPPLTDAAPRLPIGLGAMS